MLDPVQFDVYNQSLLWDGHKPKPKHGHPRTLGSGAANLSRTSTDWRSSTLSTRGAIGCWRSVIRSDHEPEATGESHKVHIHQGIGWHQLGCHAVTPPNSSSPNPKSFTQSSPNPHPNAIGKQFSPPNMAGLSFRAAASTCRRAGQLHRRPHRRRAIVPFPMQSVEISFRVPVSGFGHKFGNHAAVQGTTEQLG